MINVKDLLYEICEDKAVYDDNCELIESGILDSFAFIELFARLEDFDIFLQPTRIDRNLLKTPKTIETLITNYLHDKIKN